jgi:hypothetical protein
LVIIKLKTEAAGARVEVVGMCFPQRMKKNASRAAIAHLFAANFGKTAGENETEIRLVM